MCSELSRDIILPEKSGFVRCPFDGRAILRRTPETTLLAVAVTFLSVPTDGYHLADGWTVEKMVETNNYLLGK